jgi:hypothetical protein
MRKIVLAGALSFIGAVALSSLSSCAKRQYECTCTFNNQTTQHLSGIYRSKKDAKNWCANYEVAVEGTSCAITN